jgi:hypothetical protein
MQSSRMSPFRRPVSAAKNSVPGSKFGDWFDDCVGGTQFGPDRLHHPVFRYRTPRVIRGFVPRTAGFFEFVLVSASVSARQKGGSGPSVSASKNSVPDSDFRDWFDDWVVGYQFVPECLHHPVSANRTFPIRRQIGPFCGDFRSLNSRIFVSAGGSRILVAILASCLRIQKFRSQRLRFCGGMSFACCLVRSPLTGSSSAP